MNIKSFKHSQITLKPNYKLIPVTQLQINDEGTKIFNEVVDWCESQNFNTIIRSNSGGISFKTILPAYDVKMANNRTGAEITILCKEGCYRIQARNAVKTTKLPINGKQAYIRLKYELKRDGINLEDYFIENGEEIKKEIEKPLIMLVRESAKDLIFENANHIDFHSSYAGGLANSYPEFRPTLERLYNERHLNNDNKHVLNLSIGYFQSSSNFNAKLAHLSKAAISDNNRRIKELAEELEKSGRIILAYNTDGIWYSGKVYHGPGEGFRLGQWENDHVNCTIRFKSAGAYEFTEKGSYNPVIRGYTTLDRVKDREKWQWGDIYKSDAAPLQYLFINNRFVKEEE